LKDKIELVSGDIKRVANKLPKLDVIVMPRPRLKDSFLEQAFSLSKKKTRIYYYDFCKIEYQSDVYGMTTPYGLKDRRFCFSFFKSRTSSLGSNEPRTGA